jgi:hypothetical protein
MENVSKNFGELEPQAENQSKYEKHKMVLYFYCSLVTKI